MIFKPGFSSTVAAWAAAIVAVLAGHHYLPSNVQALIVLAAGLVTHAHVTAKGKAPAGPSGATLKQALEAVSAQQHARAAGTQAAPWVNADGTPAPGAPLP